MVTLKLSTTYPILLFTYDLMLSAEVVICVGGLFSILQEDWVLVDVKGGEGMQIQKLNTLQVTDNFPHIISRLISVFNEAPTEVSFHRWSELSLKVCSLSVVVSSTWEKGFWIRVDH